MDMHVPGTPARLSDLPTEVLGIICRPLSLRDRVCLSSTCPALRHGMAGSKDAWGALKFTDQRSSKRLQEILPWLSRRQQGLRRLELNCSSVPKGDGPHAAAQLAACLEGSPLVHLKLYNLELSGTQGSTGLQGLRSCTALISLALENCSLSCLLGALEQLPSLAELSLARNCSLSDASWAQMRQLTKLTRLDISSCQLHRLPAELAALPSLAELSLAGNKLGGANWDPLEQMTVLTRLNISRCGLATLPAELDELPALAALDLQGNRELGDAGEEAWAPLAHSSALTSLGLADIPFAELPPALASLAPRLLDLTLECTGYEDLWASEAALGPLLRLMGLTRLVLYCSEWELGVPLPEELSRLVALQDLALMCYDARDPRESLRPLWHLTALTHLHIHHRGLHEVPEEISHLQALKDLRFSICLQECEDIGWRPLGRLTDLTKLDLSICGVERLPPVLAELSSLAELDLGGNYHLGRGESAACIAANWAVLEHLTALTRLDTNSCQLDAVPAVFAALPGLRVLNLLGNPLLGRGGIEALRPLEWMTALQHLDLVCCSVPRELEVDALPFPLHRLEGWAERIEGLSEEETRNLKLG